MGRPERIININVRQFCKLLSEIVFRLAKLRIFFRCFVLYGLFFVEAKILQQHTLAALKSLRFGLCVITYTIICENDALA